MAAFIITGASRGFGRALVVELAQKFPKSHFLLMGRTVSSNLQMLAENLRREYAEISITIDELDFSLSAESVAVKSKDILLKFKQSLINIDEITLFNNAGSLGHLQKFSLQSAFDISSALQENVLSMAIFTKCFLELFPPESNSNSHVQIINISSLAAIQPFDCWSLYCMGKSARDMLIKCLAAEYNHLKQSEFRVLNYAPGPLDTDMQSDIRKNMPDCELKETFVKMKATGSLVQPRDSAKILVNIILTGSFDSGSHIDYYDCI